MVFKSTYERRVGGTTWHWLGNCPRLLPSDFKSESLYGFGKNWPIDYETLEPWYCQAEKELGVAGDHEQLNGLFGAHRSEAFPMNRIWPSYSDLKVAEALQDSAHRWPEYNDEPMVLFCTPQARNSVPYDGRPVCTGNSSCVPICPRRRPNTTARCISKKPSPARPPSAKNRSSHGSRQTRTDRSPA